MRTTKSSDALSHKIRRQFITGLLATLPLAGTIYIFFWIFNFSEHFFGNLLRKYFGVYFIGIGVAGILLTIIIIWIIGIITSSYMGKKILNLQDVLFSKIPFLRIIFKTLKQLSHSIFDDKKKAFKYPVLVEIFNRNYYSIGFLTDDKGITVSSCKEKMYHVFVPTAPNPTSGFLILINQKGIKRLNISVEEAFKTIVTAGIIHSDKYKIKREDNNGR